MREVDEKQEISLLWPKGSSIRSAMDYMNLKLISELLLSWFAIKCNMVGVHIQY